MKIIFIAIAALFFLDSAHGQVHEFTNNETLRNANISLLVQDVNGGKTHYEYRSKHPVVPASTLKLITTATALELLGADYRFATLLQIDGKLTADSILNGNIYITGSGDPTLGSAQLGDIYFLEKWVDAIKSYGIKKINGNIIADATAYDTEGVNPAWTWEDIGNYYAPGIYGISYKDNTYRLTLKSGAVGTTPQIVNTIPNIPELDFKLYVKSNTIQKDSAYIYGAPFANERSIYGEIPANRNSFTIKGDIPRPGLILARDLRWKLTSNGIPVSGDATDQIHRKKVAETIYTHYSPTLQHIVSEINIHSNNHYAEQLFRHLSYSKYGIGSTQKSLKIVRDFWKSKKLPIAQLMMHDGCGLAPANAVSANFFVLLLRYMATSKNYSAYVGSLPTSGKSGTLTNFLRNTHLTGKVFAKSGTIQQVKCYAGYIHTSNRKYAFAIMVNNATGKSYDAKKEIEKLLLKIVP